MNPFAKWTPRDAEAHNAKVSGCTSEGDQEMRRASSEPESKLHRDIIDFCDAQWPRWPYLRCRMDKRSTIEVGAHDFTIFAPHGTFCIECKRVGGKLSPEQRVWAKRMEVVNHTVHQVETMERFLEIVKLESVK